MSENMTPAKQIIAEQIDEVVANYRATLKECAGKFDSEIVRTVLERSEFVDEQLAILLRYMEVFNDLIVHHRVKVDRHRTSQEALDAAATGRRPFTDRNVVNEMPVGEGDEVDVVYFKPKPWEYTRPSYISNEDLEKALRRRNLRNDPRAVMADNENNYAFTDDHPHGVVGHWEDTDGTWGPYVIFEHWCGERSFGLGRGNRGWDGDCLFAGVRK